MAGMQVWVMRRALSMSTGKHAQHVSCELSFIWGEMRTIAWEMASQVALRNSSEEAGGGKLSIIYDFS